MRVTPNSDERGAVAVMIARRRLAVRMMRCEPTTAMSRMPSSEPPRVGQTLASLRQARGLSLDELSRQAGVSKSMLSQIERNQAGAKDETGFCSYRPAQIQPT